MSDEEPPTNPTSRVAESATQSWSHRLGLRPSASPSRRRTFFLAFWSTLAIATAYVGRHVLLPFFLAIVVAYVLAPVVKWIAKKGLPIWVAVVGVYVIFLGATGVLIGVGGPRLVGEIQSLARDVPTMVREVREDWLPSIDAAMRSAIASSTPSDEDERQEAPALPEGGAEETEPGAPSLQVARDGLRILPEGDGWRVALPEGGLIIEPRGERLRIIEARPDQEVHEDLADVVRRAIEHATEDTRQTATTVLRAARGVVEAVVKGVFTFFLMLMLSAYLLISSERIFGFFRGLWPPHRRSSFDELLVRIDRGLSGVVRGQLLISVVNGAFSGIGFFLLDLRYWPVLTLIATALSVIPIFGAILSTIPAVIVALQDGPEKAAFVVAWILLIHQIEANVLNPKIMGDAAKVHPVMVVFALLVGESLYGLVGALLAVPVLSIAQSLFNHYRVVYLPDSESSDTSAPEVARVGEAAARTDHESS